MAAELDKLKEWIGQRESDIDYITVPSIHRLSATLDRDDPIPKFGDALPIGWHTILFPRVVRQSQIGPDGHPKRGDFLPPVPLPRRMFAGKRITFAGELRVGDEVRRDSTIKDVVVKEGRTGQMVFVTVKTDIASPRGLAVSEDKTSSTAPSLIPMRRRPRPRPLRARLSGNTPSRRPKSCSSVTRRSPSTAIASITIIRT